MSYQALYRVWRPQRFDDIAGQEAVTRTLKNALIQGKNSHAYLFTGPRGTGKTSAAKIFAKAINCPNQEDGEPCNQCEICQAITEGRLNDVIEIDAASNNGVEEIRDIRDKARYAPTQAEYKIYIIDEVHMLSTGAFNALLKTLEEPPAKVIFILATTEPHKIPLTIISRTQRFDFKRITYQAILSRMSYILEQEGIKYEEQALHVIARAANGGMRDALSLLDQVISYDSDCVTFDHAIQVSGSLTEEMMIAFLEALWNGNAESALHILHDILENGKEAGRFLEEMILFSRDILVYKQTENQADSSEQTTEQFRSFSKEVNSSFLYRAVEEFSYTQKEMRFSTQPDVYLEVLAVKLSQSDVVVTIPAEVSESHTNPQDVSRLEKEVASLKKELAALLDSVKNGTIQASDTPAAKPTTSRLAVSKNGSSFKPNFTSIQAIMRSASKQELVNVKSNWVDILDTLSVTQRAVLRQAEPVAANAEACILSFEYEILCQKASEDEELRAALEEAISRMSNRPGDFVCVTAEQWGSLRKSYVQELKARKHEPSSAASERENQTDEKQEQPKRTNIPADQPLADYDDRDAPPIFDDLAIEMSPSDEEETKQQEVVEQAISIFGKENITVINE
ncbi:MAG TPA: DNA polymerase III subunit gamma/tau [Candidatus Jeotgalibaca pullicola]|nr:DNA polymerase III subunit gamma/tau [Candidatus Jeotgalibaca pullicola]